MKETIPSKKLTDFTLPKEIQAIPIESNFRKSKWLLLPIYRPHTMPVPFFVEQVSTLLYHYHDRYDNIINLGDFHLDADDSKQNPLIERHNLIKEPTCFKRKEGSCIDLILTNKKHIFFNNKSFETEMRGHHLIILRGNLIL